MGLCPKPLDAVNEAKSRSSSRSELWLNGHLRQVLFLAGGGLQAGVGSEKGEGAVRPITPAPAQPGRGGAVARKRVAYSML